MDSYERHISGRQKMGEPQKGTLRKKCLECFEKGALRKVFEMIRKKSVWNASQKSTIRNAS